MEQKLLFILSKGMEKAGLATRAFYFAMLSAEQGNRVEIALIEDGVYWAQLGMAEGVYAPTGEKMKDIIDKIVEYGCPIYLCKACADKRLIGPEDIIKGSEIAGGGVIVGKMADPSYKVFIF
ncbi:MAG: DsrE family protein [Syntrophobacterales bacterium]|nr:DsrE family protein [Syntrophobacterales bacterium]